MELAALPSHDVAGRVILQPGKATPFFHRHPWVLDTSIARVEGQPGDGQVVDLFSPKGQFIARGLYNSRSRIRVRLYTWRADEALDEVFWRRQLATAVDLRRVLRLTGPEEACRLVFSEADGMSGLVVDRYGRHLVVQLTAAAMAARHRLIVNLLAELVRPASITLRIDPAVAQAEGIEASRDWPGWGTPPQEPIEVREHGIVYLVDLREGQKTGLYLDQRENHRSSAGYLAGRRVLDLFCYVGGFSLAAAVLGGAAEVRGYDSSAKAVAAAQHNAQRNGVANAAFEVGDGFDVLQQLASAGQRFGGIVLDPPRFAGSRRHLDQALRAYHRLNRLAVNLLEPGGMLVTCSCSGHVSREMFRDMLLGVVHRCGREVQVLQQRGAAPDHPVRLTCPESEYLKCFICRVL